MKKIVSLVVFAILISVSFAIAKEAKVIDVSRFNVEMKITPPSATRTKTSLNGMWDFYPLSGVTEYKAPEKVVDEAKWEKIIVPSDWKATTLGYGKDTKPWHVNRNMGYPPRWNECGAAWYRRDLVVPNEMKGSRVVLDFKGVNHYIWVYLNGKFAGEHEGGWTPFQIDITKLALYGEKNIISAYVMD